MPGHDSARASRDSRTERGELDAVQMRAVARYSRQIEMRIGACVAVTGKMFRGRQPAVFFDTAYECRDELGHARRVFAEGARVDNGIAGVAVDVGIGREDPRNARG